MSENFKLQLKGMEQKDIPFLYEVYKSTRIDELAVVNWTKNEMENFFIMQFNLQHKQYIENYKNGNFDIILFNDLPVGRLYVERAKKDIRVIDIAILKEYRRKGIGSTLISTLIEESERTKLPLSLHVERDNPIMPFYKKIGFKELEDRGIYIFMERLPN